MYGNRLGWGISVAIVMVVLWLVYLLQASQTVSPPTAWVAASVKPISFPGSIETVVPDTNDPADAGAFYRAAAAAYASDTDTYDKLGNSSAALSDREVSSLPAVRALLDATRCKTMSLFANSPGEIINYSGDNATLNSLDGAAQATLRCGLRIAINDAKSAAKYYRAVYSLGAKLFNERLAYKELDKGSGLMGSALVAMRSLADRQHDQAASHALTEAESDRRSEQTDLIQPVAAVITSNSTDTIGSHAGDLFAIANGTASVEKLWRTEAILTLGRMKYNTTRAGDQRGAMRALRKLALDKDPAVRTAATAARDLTIEDYRNMR